MRAGAKLPPVVPRSGGTLAFRPDGCAACGQRCAPRRRDRAPSGYRRPPPMARRAARMPAPEAREDRRPGRDGGRRHATGTAGAGEVEHRLYRRAAWTQERPPPRRRRREQGLRRRPRRVTRASAVAVRAGSARGRLGLKSRGAATRRPQSAPPRAGGHAFPPGPGTARLRCRCARPDRDPRGPARRPPASCVPACRRSATARWGGPLA